MNVYDYIDKFSEAIRDAADVLSFCTTNYNKGLRIQIDDDSEKMLGSNDSPYCLLMPVPGSDNSPVSEASAINIRIEVGVVSDSEAPTQTTGRTALANGLYKLGNGEKAIDLLDKILTVVKGVEIDACTLLHDSSIESSGALFFPLALAFSTLTVRENKDLSSFS